MGLEWDSSGTRVGLEWDSSGTRVTLEWDYVNSSDITKCRNTVATRELVVRGVREGSERGPKAV